jgi:MFS family permease
MSRDQEKPLHWYDYITINIYWFALTTRSQTITPLILPLLVQQFVGEESKGTYLGMIRLWALMVALLWQALMGMISDQSTLKLGRRRPFILIGTFGEIIAFMLIGFTAGLQGMTGYWVLFLVYIFSMLASNTAHAATQGLIPDLVPENMRGRFSGVKAMLELPVPLIFVSFVIGRMISAGNLWGALVTLMAVILVCGALSMFARETPLEEKAFKFEWKPFARLALMTAAFTAIILLTGNLVNRVMASPGDGSQALLRLFTGLAGFVGMSIAIVLGVWSGINIGIGAEARQRTSFTWWVVNRLAFLVPANNLAGFMIFFLQERFAEMQGEKAAGPAAMVIMFVGVFVLIFALPSGWLADRFGKKPLVAISGLVAAAGTAVVLLIPNMTAIYVGACLVGSATGLFYSANWALGTDLAPKEQAGRYLGLSNLAGAGAGAIGAYIGGPIADNMGYVLLFSIYGALFLLSSFVLIGIKEN